MTNAWGFGDGGILDQVDFTDTSIDFVYDDVPGSPQRRLATELCRAIPRGWCTGFQNLADAYNLVALRRRLGFPKQNTLTFARLVNEYARLRASSTTEWSVPWHRMRDAAGHCRSPNHPPGESAVVLDPEDLGNIRALAEGIRLIPEAPLGRVNRARMFDIRQAVRAGRVPGLP